MTSKHDKAVIARLMRIKGATIYTDNLKAKVVKLPKKPREKSEPTGMAELKIGRNVLMVDNENVKPGGEDDINRN